MGQFTSLDRLAEDPASQVANRRKGRRRLLASAIVAGFLLTGVGGWGAYHRASAPVAVAAPPSPAEVDVSAPLLRMVARTTDFTGQFSAVDQVDLRAQVSGYITEIRFIDGQIVQKGDLLFVIDPEPYEIARQRAVAQFQTAVTSLDLANKQVARTAELVKDSFASRELLDQRIQTQRASLAAIDQAKADIDAAKLNLKFTRITAPFGGRVSMRHVSIGSLVTAGAGSASGTSLTNIVSLDPIHLDFDMSEADYLAYQRFLARKLAGLSPTVQVSLSDEQSWSRQGELTFIDNQVDRGSGTLHARATLPNTDLLIAPGQFARLRLPVGAPLPVMLVPDSAVVADQSRKLLMVVDDGGTVVAKPVEVGALEGEQLRIITRGIEPTDKVVIGGLMRIRPGSKATAKPATIAVASGS